MCAVLQYSRQPVCQAGGNGCHFFLKINLRLGLCQEGMFISLSPIVGKLKRWRLWFDPVRVGVKGNRFALLFCLQQCPVVVQLLSQICLQQSPVDESTIPTKMKLNTNIHNIVFRLNKRTVQWTAMYQLVSATVHTNTRSIISHTGCGHWHLQAHIRGAKFFNIKSTLTLIHTVHAVYWDSLLDPAYICHDSHW